MVSPGPQLSSTQVRSLIEDARILRQVPLFATLPDELFDRVAAEARQVRVPAGEWLLRAGEDADSLFVIVAGRLEVLGDDPEETRIRSLRRGDVLGELALLSGGTRSASVRALRDSELVELTGGQFEALLREVPSFAVALAGAMAVQLAANRSPAAVTEQPRVISVLRLDPGSPAEAGRMLAEELARHGSLQTLTGEGLTSGPDMSEALDRAERSAGRVLMIGEGHDPATPWNTFCLREADLLVAFAAGTPDHGWAERAEALGSCELLVTGSGKGPASLAGIEPRGLRIVADGDLQAAVAQLARRLAGRAVGVVLSGGGARAFAHLGVMEELLGSGLVVDRVAGVSMGAVVAAGIALGGDPAELSETFAKGFAAGSPTRDYTLPLYSLTRGRRADRLLAGLLGEARIEELGMRYFALSCDLIARERMIHRTGPLATAVRASLAIPGVFPPVRTPDGRLLVDGGVLDNLPVETMAAEAEGPVIAVDVTGQIEAGPRVVRPRLERLTAPLRSFLTGSEARLPRLTETMMRTVTVGSIDTVAEGRKHADLVIQPEVDGCGTLDWGRLAESREAGRHAAREALDSGTVAELPFARDGR